MTKIVPLIAGNWKMNGLKAALGELDRLSDLLAGDRSEATIALCPPATLLAAMSDKGAAFGLKTGGQDCHFNAKGAHTGDISASMLADAGASYVITGHSERRADHGETDELVRAKSVAAIGAKLIPIICVGETEAERRAGQAESVVATQLAGSVPEEADVAAIVIAYEPVWAIGTGLTPTTEDIVQMHKSIRLWLVERLGERGQGVQILYGGSLKPANAKEILALENVNGGLIGGASLLANDFYAIISAA